MYPNIQAYDRGVMFDPTGRLFQVEYAKEAVRKGATSLGIVAEDSIVLVAHRNIAIPLAVPSTLQKIFRADSHIAVTYSGIVSDGLHMINVMRNKAQSHRMIYDETESVETITREIAEEIQMATQYGGMRPYGISMLVGGIDSDRRLFEIEPDAAFLGYKAAAIGSGKKAAEEILVKEYKEGMSTKDAVDLGISIIRKIGEKKLSSDDLEIATITKVEGYRMFKPDEIAKLL
ncbi:MAG: archaeal proteasome endopeptidase complex subunit alpha [Candidatus Micrarchaeaceae archaeon]